MATNDLSRAFSGGAVVAPQGRQLNVYANLLAKQDAKRDALEQYYQKALTETTPTGMRSKDIIGGWNQKLKDWQNFGIENKKYLLNPQLDDYKTLTEFNNRHSDLMADIEKSKRAAQDEKDIYALNKTGKWTPTGELDQNTGKFTPGSDLDIKERLSKSIYDPTRLDEKGNEPSVSDFSINAPDLTPQQLLQANKNVEFDFKRGKQKVGEETRNPITGKVEQQYHDVFQPEQIMKMADNYGAMVNGNKSLTKHYNNMLHSGDLEHLDKLNQAYHSIYPNGQMDTPAELAKAETILLKSTPSNTRVEAVPDTELAQRRKQSNIALSAALNYNNYVNKEDFATRASNAAIDVNKVNASDEFNKSVGADGAVKISPKMLGITDPAKVGNLKLDKDGKTITYDRFDKDNNIVAHESISRGTALREFGKSTGYKLDYSKISPTTETKPTGNHKIVKIPGL
jgi:hypothetical protein